MMTSAAKHTAGPWKWTWENMNRDWAIVTDAHGSIVANVNPGTGPDACSAPATRRMPAEANARLIAAAPDMRDVCAAFSVTNEGGIVTLRSNGRTIARASSRSDTGKELLRLGRLRRTALAKAEGGAA